MVYFVSGHRDLSEELFDKYYKPAIRQAAYSNWNAEFVVGDCMGVDKMAMDYIVNETACEVTIYHMFDSPRNTPNNWTIDECDGEGIHFESGFTSDIERDSAMTKFSDADIAFIFNDRWKSGTAQNIKRRHDM